MSLSEEQSRAAYAPTSVAVVAGAGTGKTHMLSERYVHHLQADGLSPLQVVAVTFTEKAAAELRARIREKAEQVLGDRPELIAELEAAPISTIHALASRVCREHPELAGVPADFRVLDEQEGSLWRLEQMLEAVSGLDGAIFARLPYTWLAAILPDLLADPVTAAQALARTSDHWAELATRLRREALEELLATEALRQADSALALYAGQADDRRELARRTAVAGMAALRADIAAGRVPDAALKAIDTINLQGGSAKKWPDGGFSEVTEALKALRGAVREALGQGLVTLALGPADAALEALLPALREAYEGVSTAIARAKRTARLLDFSDLEVHALRALAHTEVRDYYAQRWKAFLVDEFQDTNPVQAQLLEALIGSARLTVVGDEKQAIYGFRRADTAVFRRFQQRIREQGGANVALTCSYRTHEQLIDGINRVFAPLLGEARQDLGAVRTPPHAGPHLSAFYIAVPETEGQPKVSKEERQRAEARAIARRVRALLDSGLRVYDKAERRERELRYSDVAILGRVWGPLDLYGEALAAEGIPAVNAGGGSLMDTREASDGFALLRFLADTRDDLALVAVLRSPFFAVSDRVLFDFVQQRPERGGWWTALDAGPPPQLAFAVDVLRQLLRLRRTEPPSRLLSAADALCGYTAVIGNLPGPRRRLADWDGFRAIARQLEDGAQDVFHVVRRLKRLAEAEVELPRPMLEAGDAVALMTIHAAKGLEWPVVIVPDLTRKSPNSGSRVLFDAELGVAIKLEQDDEELPQPVLFTALLRRRERAEEEERKRVFYVALTRARDQLILSAAEEKGHAWDLLQPGFAAAETPITAVPFDPADARPVLPPRPAPYPEPARFLIEAVGHGLRELPVTALSEYQRCPKRFRYHYVDGHPGLADELGTAARVGTLVHLALELGIRELSALRRFDPLLPEADVEDALALAMRFDSEALYAPWRAEISAREHPVQLALGGLTLNGVVDALGPDFVLDFKTDREVAPEHHQFQVWVYARATGRSRAVLAYLRHGQLQTFDEAALAALTPRAEAMLAAIQRGAFEATPSAAACGACAYAAVCEEQCGVVASPARNPWLRDMGPAAVESGA